MGKGDRERSQLSTGMSDAVASFLDSVARFLFTFGALAALAGAAVLVYTFIVFLSGTGANVAQALINVNLFGKIAIAGFAAASVGAAYLFWGEETLGPVEVIVGALIFFSPYYLPVFFEASRISDTSAKALTAFQNAGLPVGVIGLVVILVDLVTRVKVRARDGMRAETLKYGKGFNKEKEFKNVLLGKCWQLPYCRKFVREKCPIYHARRTCWRERVGCMCEEKVIQNAMAGKVVSSDPAQAAKMIPVNTKLPEEMKAERCRQCAIYNEHQKHKYRVVLPASLALVGGVYFLFHGPLVAAAGAIVAQTDALINKATYRTGSELIGHQSPIPFTEIVLGCVMLIVLAYVLRLVEYLIFKLKV